VKMSGSIDLKTKRPIEDDYGRTPEEETKENYKAILHMVNDQMQEKEKRHSAQTEVYYISDQVKLLEEMEKKALFNVKAEKERLQAKLLLGNENLATVKVPYIDWDKIGNFLNPKTLDEVDQWFKLNNVLTPDTDGRACLQSGDSWSPPEEGRIKCNIHVNWRNASLYISFNHYGNVIHHARDAIVNAPNRLIAEIRCVIWTLTSLSDLGVTNVIIALDYNEVMEAIKLPLQWPRYRATGLQEKRREEETRSNV
ncbi:LOW QUALITY PROTEIN: hypothetical protein HID58_048479, partial [Brassica napus]